MPEHVFNYKLIDAMVKEMRVYPEGHITSAANKTSIHAAAIGGNIEKLKVLMKDIDKRYFSANLNDTKKDFNCYINETEISEDLIEVKVESKMDEADKKEYHKSLESYRRDKIRSLLKNKAFRGSLLIYT